MDQKEQFAFSYLHSPEFDHDSYSKAQTSEEDFNQKMDESLFSSSSETNPNETIEENQKAMPSRSWKRPKSRAVLEQQFSEKYMSLFSPTAKYAQTDTAINDIIDILGQ